MESKISETPPWRREQNAKLAPPHNHGSGTTLTTAQLEMNWRLMVLIAVASVRGGATSAGLQRGLTLIPSDAVYACLMELERAGLITRRSMRSGHPSGSMLDRWSPAPDVSLKFDI